MTKGIKYVTVSLNRMLNLLRCNSNEKKIVSDEEFSKDLNWLSITFLPVLTVYPSFSTHSVNWYT